MENQSIAKNLLYQRKLKGYTQEDLSSKTQVTVRTIQRIEKGSVQPHLQTIKLLAAGLGVEVDALLPLEDPKEETIQKKWLILLHSTPFLGFIIPLANILIPLFLWIHKREDNKVYDVHGVQIINFQITISILYALSLVALVTIEKWGFFLFISVIPISVCIMLFNIVRVLNGKTCRYPFIPFLQKSKSVVTNVMLGLLLMGITTGCNVPKNAPSVQRLDGSEITMDSLTLGLEKLAILGRVHGMAVTVFNENEVVYQHLFGYKNRKEKLPFTDSTNVYGGSLSKAVFGVLVMKLVENGVLDLDTPLESYLPKKIYEYEPLTRWHDDFSALKNDSLYHKITARMCLSHTTGFANSRWLEEDHQLRVNREPGSRYFYSGEGFIYLQVVLEKLLKKNLEVLAQELIFKPLDMKNSSYQWSTKFEDDFAHGHGSNDEIWKKDIDNEPRAGSTLETTPEDYTKFLTGMLQGKILSKKSFDELFSPQIKIRAIKQFGPLALKDSTLNDGIELSYGLGWGILQTPYGKGAFKSCHGNGFQHYSILFPDAKKGVLLMTNSDNGEGIYKEALELIMKDVYTPWEWGNYIPYHQK